MQSDAFIDSEGNFVFSGESSDIYQYKCFDDRSNPNWIDGQEYIDNPDWDQEKKDLWNFFYRPYNYGHNIGREQKAEIKKKQSGIDKLKNNYQDARVKKIASLFLFFAILISVFWSFNAWALLLFPILMYLFFYLEEKNITAKISLKEGDLYILKKEVDYLLDQHQELLNSRTKSEQVENIFWYKLRALEHEVYKNYFFTDIRQVKSDIPDFYTEVNEYIKGTLSSSNEIFIHPLFPVIPTWGLLQPVKTGGNNYRATGVRAAREEMAEKIATFRGLSDGRPFYRLWYIQYIFFTKNSFSIVSFCYDFITGKKYNVAGDTHQLNHITNSSSGDEDILHFLDSEFIQSLKLPENFINNVYVSQVKNLNFSMSSGTSYSCFIPSKKVIEGLSIWLELNKSKFPVIDMEDESSYLYDKVPELKFMNNYILEILADRVADALRKYIDRSRPLTAEEHQENITVVA